MKNLMNSYKNSVPFDMRSAVRRRGLIETFHHVKFPAGLGLTRIGILFSKGQGFNRSFPCRPRVDKKRSIRVSKKPSAGFNRDAHISTSDLIPVESGFAQREYYHHEQEGNVGGRAENSPGCCSPEQKAITVKGNRVTFRS